MAAANENKLSVVGVGSFSLLCLIREAEGHTIVRILTLTDMFHIPEAGRSRLISLFQLLTSPYQQNLGADITKEGLTISAG